MINSVIFQSDFATSINDVVYVLSITPRMSLDESTRVILNRDILKCIAHVLCFTFGARSLALDSWRDASN